ncbi:hypothetical protein FO519_006589 [Halicephalobus sp. NKZ332]|nr:hypothetical protein FO519_006589 [Halicephalobus sp. NKZ332]
MPDNGRSRRRRRATIARSHVLTFHIIDEKVASGLRRVDDLIPDEFKQNWFVGRPSIEKDYYFFEQPGVGISGRAGQNLISEKGIEDINKEFSEISDFSLIVEDANGVPVSQPPKDRTVEYIFANISNIQSLSELKADKSALFKKTKKDESNLLKKYKNDEDAIMPMVYEEDEIAESSPDLGSSSTNKSRKESEDYFPEASILKNSILSSIAPSARSRNISQDSFWTLLKKTPEAKSTPKPKTAIERRRTLVANKTPETKEGLTTSKTPEVRTTLGAKRSLETKSTSEAKGTPETKRKTSDFVLQNSTLSNEKSNEANLSTTVQSNNSDVFDNEINLIPINNESLKSDSPCPLEDSLFGNLQSPESSKENLKPSLSPVLSFKKSDEDEQALAQEEEHIDKVSSQIGISKSEISKTSNNDRFEKSLDRVDVCEENEIFKMQEDGFHKSTGHIDNYESNENDVLIQEEEEFDRPPSQGGLYGNDEDEIRDDESIRSDTTCASNISRSSYVVRVIDGQQAFFLKGFRGEDSELAKLCFVCKQPTIQGWNSLFLKLSQEKIVKLGEGAFGEVYRGIFEKEMVALKIFPFKESLDSNKIYPEVNGNIMMPVDEVTNEVVLTQEVSKLCSYENGKTPNFIGLRRTFVLRGKYPEDFTKAWESYDKKKRSENDHPSQYSSSSRHYITMALELGGSDLEHFQIKNEKQVVSIFIQVALSLAIAETSLEFEHRDLHWGNILVKKITTKKPLEYCYKGKKVEVAHQGLSVKIIDFTLSRICKENTIIYRNLEEDPFLFEQEVTDMQFQVYKDMRTLTKGRWHEFWPGTNCLWLEYLADKLLYGVKGINVPSGIMKDKKEKLMEVFRLKIFVLIFAFLPLLKANPGTTTKIIQFLLKNHELCGKPFADAEWIPVLDMCEKECNELTELCVENDSLIQKCQKYMDESCLDSEDILHIKWRVNKNRWRRFSIPKSGLNFRCFLDFLKSVEPGFDGNLDYVDDEGDFVRISSTSGITELIRTCELMKLKTVYVHSADDSK